MNDIIIDLKVYNRVYKEQYNDSESLRSEYLENGHGINWIDNLHLRREKHFYEYIEMQIIPRLLYLDKEKFNLHDKLMEIKKIPYNIVNKFDVLIEDVENYKKL